MANNSFADADGKPLLIKANLALPRCPHCKIAQPLLESKAHAQSNGTSGHRTWYLYTCSVCGGGVLAAHASNIAHVIALYPFAAPVTDHDHKAPIEDTHPHLREFLAFLEELNRESERGAVLVAATMIDELLRRSTSFASVVRNANS
jgi:hypothetical protein